MKLLVKNLLIVIASITFLLSQGQTLMNVYQNNGSVIQIPLSTIDSITYTIGNPGNPASFNAIQSIENVTANAATCDVTIYDDGGSQITERGICWNTSPNPTTANYKTNDGVGIGDFTSAIQLIDCSG